MVIYTKTTHKSIQKPKHFQISVNMCDARVTGGCVRNQTKGKK